MLPPGHLIIPFAVVEYATKRHVHRQWVVMSTLVFSILPDIDVVFLGRVAGHHQTITHTPIFWLSSGFCLWAASKFFKQPKVVAVSIGLLVGSLSHMVLDTFGMSMGVAWLAPFSQKEYSFLPINPEYAANQWLQHYLESPAFWIEVAAVVVIATYYGYGRIKRSIKI